MKARFLVFALMGLSALALADSSLKSQMEAMNKPITAAMLKRDVNAFRNVVKGGVTSDFKYSEPGGKPMNFDAMIGGMKAGFAMYSKITKASSEIVTVKEKGNVGS